MTQDMNSSDAFGPTPDQATVTAENSSPATPKKSTRKTKAVKKAATKAASAKNTASVTKDALEATDAPAKKPRTTSKAKASTKAIVVTADERTGTIAKAASEVPEQGEDDKPAARKALKKTPIKKTSKKEEKLDKVVASGDLVVKSEMSPAPMIPGKNEPEAAKVETQAETAPAPAKAALSRRTGRQKTAKGDVKTAPVEKPELGAQPAPITQSEPADNTESAQETTDDTIPKTLSRRSRRGGRRRNKSRQAAEAKIAAETPVVQDSDITDVESDAEVDAIEKKTPAKDSSKKSVAVDSEEESAPDSDPDEKASGKGAKRKMFISVLSGELVEVVLAEEGSVVEYYVEMQHQAKVKGNIYKGVVSNIDANLQAAFISYANGAKNGFLQIDEVHPEYYVAHHDLAKGRKHPPIQKILRQGQEILVQVVKEPAGTKGAFLTSYLSLPGRFLVLTPGREQIGVSRKVDDDEERSRLRGLLEGLKPGKGLGVIVRTVSTGASKTSLQRDLQFLKRLWKDVRSRGQSSPTPGCVYEELDLSTRAVRDYLTDDVQEVWVDDAVTAGQVKELASLLFPRKTDLVHVHYDSGHSLFERFSIHKQLDQIHSREVSLPSGGRLVIDNTEALTAIDINSGRSSGKSNFEDMAYRTNLEAAKAIPLQLRLRDIGGQVVADFIEMRDREHWREVEKTVRNGMKGDRARYDVGKIGPFGMLEIVRQRLGSSAISISTELCPCCKGTGIRRKLEWQAMQSLRDIGRQLRQAAANNQVAMTFYTEPELAFYLLNSKRAILQSLETDAGVTLTVSPKTE